MRLKLATEADVTIVALTPGRDRYVNDRTSDELRATLRTLLQEGRAKILVDLEQHHIAARTIDLFAQMLSSNPGTIYLCNGDVNQKGIFATYKFDRFLNVFESRAEAVQFLAGIDVRLTPRLFTFHASQLRDISKRVSYLWPSTETPVTVTLSGETKSGGAMVHVFDAADTEMITRSAAEPGSTGGLTGKAGFWRVGLEFIEYSGSLELVIQGE